MTFPAQAAVLNDDHRRLQHPQPTAAGQQASDTPTRPVNGVFLGSTQHQFRPLTGGENETTARSHSGGFTRLALPLTIDATTPRELIEAARQGDFTSVSSLLQQNPLSADATLDSTQETAFSAAFGEGHRNVCELLLEYGARATGVCISFSDERVHRDSVVRFAVREANLPLLQWLLERGAAVYTPEIDGTQSVLALAAWNGECEIVSELVRQGARLDAVQCIGFDLPVSIPLGVWNMEEQSTDLTSYRLLAIACWRHHHRLTKLLLSSHTSLHDRDLMRKYGAIAIYFAVYRENDSVIQELLARGAQADSYIDGCVPVMAAAVQVDSVRLLRLLLQQNNVASGSCDTLLLDAVNNGAIECVQELLSRTTKSPLRDEALELAVANNAVDIAVVLLQGSPMRVHPSRLERCLRDASEDGNSELLELLLTHQGATVDVRFLHKCAALACLKGHAEVVSLLLAYGVDVDAPSMHGTSFLLHEVVSTVFRHARAFDVAKLLLEHGASVDATNTFDETPLEALHHKRSQAKTSEGVAQFQAMYDLLESYGARYSV